MNQKRLLYGSGILLLALLVTLVVWQGSFHFGGLEPTDAEQTLLFWAVSTLIFLLTVTLGFMLGRTAIKLYIERRSNRIGSRIRVKLVAGALALTFVPVVFLVLFSVEVLNRNLDKWFSRPAQKINLNLRDIASALEREARQKVQAQAWWLAGLPETWAALEEGGARGETLTLLCHQHQIEWASVERPGQESLPLCGEPPVQVTGPQIQVRVALPGRKDKAELVVQAAMAVDLAAQQQLLEEQVRKYDELNVYRKGVRATYLQLLLLITLFILFVATWLALFLSKQISVPISSLLQAAAEVRQGNLRWRIQVTATDELATLVRAFNAMTQDLEANSNELERRRRFTEAILESIPTGVLSLSADGRIQKVNRALKGIFSAERVDAARTLQDLFSREDTAEIRYLMNRARRTGLAATQLEMRTDQQVLHLSAIIALIDDPTSPGFVLVLEDTSDLMRAQRATAWQEVARRVAHEIKNPLTPIALCAERIRRYLDRQQGTAPASPDVSRVLRECSETISREVESVRTLVDAFSQFSRLPTAEPVMSTLNAVVENALAVFTGRLDSIEMKVELAPDLPPVCLDPEQFKRVVVNLVDNAAEAMQDSPLRYLYVSTRMTGTDMVELLVADTGHGVSREDKEKLFLPYFSTKNRGTGLGLAIVNRILAEHGAQIRVEDNRPRGTRFIVEIPVAAAPEPEHKPVESRA